MQSVPITIDVVISNLDQGEVLEHYLIKFVSGLKQVSGFLRDRRFPPPNTCIYLVLAIRF
jgi:hypothetical protein